MGTSDTTLYRAGHVVTASSDHCFSNSSRSSTDFSNFIRIVAREGYWVVGVLCAVTRAGYARILGLREQVGKEVGARIRVHRGQLPQYQL